MPAGVIDSSKAFVLNFQTQVGTRFRTRAKQKNKQQKKYNNDNNNNNNNNNNNKKLDL